MRKGSLSTEIALPRLWRTMKKILVIEDELQVRTNIEQILTLSDFRTIGASDGYMGLQLAKEQHPDLIICDVMMPKIDGYNVLASLRQDPSTANIPFIFLTAKADRSDVRQGMELGASDYLAKPFTTDELIGTVTTQLCKQTAYEIHLQNSLDQVRNSFTKAIPHELYTPLNDILGTIKLLIDDYGLIGEFEGLEMLESVQQSAIQLHRSIQNFLLYAELELIASNPIRLQRFQSSSEVSTTDNILKATALQKAQQYDRKQDLLLNLQNSVVRFPESRLRKVVEEIVDNAFKFSKPGTRVQIVSNVTEDTFTFYVIDNGRGMTAEQIKAIGNYMQFSRITHEQQESGLGLTIAKRIVELQGGEFSIESIPDRQTTIRIVLTRKVK